MRVLLIFLCVFALLNAASFKRDSNRDVVIDTTNSLMWMDGKENVKLYFTHEEATKYCEDLLYGAYDNWRIPHIDELKLIVDKERYPTNINKAFRYILNEGYWAETAHWRTFWFYADYMHFVSGTPYFDSRHKKKLVRCVRDTK